MVDFCLIFFKKQSENIPVASNFLSRFTEILSRLSDSKQSLGRDDVSQVAFVHIRSDL